MRDAAAPVAGWSFHYGADVVHFAVRRQQQRHNGSITIHVETTGAVVVDVPIGASRAAILAAVRKRSRWIHGHASGFRRRHANVLLREYVSGESVMYLGRRYQLKVLRADAADAGVKLRNGHLEVRSVTPTPGLVREAMEQWFRMRARAVFTERMDSILAELRWIRFTPVMRLLAMKVQWGSCSPSGRLTLNPWLVKAPRECIDYVILHELCHLKEHNHSPRFFQLVGKHMPTWRERKRRLDELAEVILNW